DAVSRSPRTMRTMRMKYQLQPNGQVTPVRSSETDHRRRAASASCACFERWLGPGAPRSPRKRVGPTYVSGGRSAVIAWKVGREPNSALVATTLLPIHITLFISALAW